MVTENTKQGIMVGKILTTKGLKGEVKIKTFTEEPLAIVDYDLYDDDNNHYSIQSAYLHKGVVIARIEGINSIEEAEKLVNKDLFVARDSLANPEKDSYYYVDLVGLQVYNHSNELIGTITAVFNFGANDVLEITQNNKETILIDFTKKNVPEVNLKDKYIKIAKIDYTE